MASTNAIGTDDPIEVAKGGSGLATATAYAPLCGGTTATAPFQSIASVGTSGQVLTSNGAGALPTMQTSTSGDGRWSYISAVTASASATVDFTSGIDSTYNVYMFTFDNLLPAVDAAALVCRTSTNAGSSFDSGAGEYSYVSASFTTTTEYTASGAATFIYLHAASTGAENIGSASNEGISGRCFLYNPSETSHYKRVEGQFNVINTLSNSLLSFGGGCRESTADVDAIQFYFHNGNAASGTVRMYGLKTS